MKSDSVARFESPTFGWPAEATGAGLVVAVVQFSSDDREASNVIVTFKSESGDWQTTISAHDLRNFCLRFIELIENTIG